MLSRIRNYHQFQGQSFISFKHFHSPRFLDHRSLKVIESAISSLPQTSISNNSSLCLNSHVLTPILSTKMVLQPAALPELLHFCPKVFPFQSASHCHLQVKRTASHPWLLSTVTWLQRRRPSSVASSGGRHSHSLLYSSSVLLSVLPLVTGRFLTIQILAPSLQHLRL